MKLATRLQQIEDYIRSYPEPWNRPAQRVVTMTDDTRSYNAMMRAVRTLVARGQLKCTAMDGSTCCRCLMR